MSAKKFGTFGGVFTPSILTILGVIMYMRLGWVVGNAGLIGAILLIVVAHVISITTGLSISSIATDKKVGAGGVYYVLSRSLGLPIGGAIGVTLWIATALSIALYLVGFSESFNAYLGLDISINGIRIAGTIALAALATIAIISTAVAIKAQYFIMAAIVLSLISIFAGTWEFAPESVPSFGPPEGITMMAVFAILFPAVTGFTAGIAMSGDLEDPKKSIPGGTIAAIAVGFVVYTVLAIFMAYAVEPEMLRNDYNILMRIAIFAPVVVAGIWGATLSSALGGILGGPRILQAMSIDRITPRLFATGVGKDKEPRNALFITLVIAECGVLIGELDMIAEVCSMFYLAAYGIINLSFFLESWASADFSPSFKVKRWVGLLGFIATFAVMFQLNPGAMVAAFIVIGGIYAYLQRKQLALSSGDVWTSVWSSLVLKGLKKMDSTEDSSRNWKPNILLFTGGTKNRPHLIEISKAIAGKVGMVSNFDLVENPEAEVLFPKHKQSVHDPVLLEHGIFGRKQEVKNIFKGIETIASTYGFSGVEPNTVMLGWAKNTKDPIWFAQMTQKLIALDYNVLYLDYDWNREFGKYQRIDIWWHNLTNNAELTLNLVKFISRSNEWSQAQLRVILINDTSNEGFERRIHKMLDTYRIEATVKVINNNLQQKSSYDLMKSESHDADLILAGIPDIPVGEERDFVERTTEMFESMPTTLLVKTSTTLGEDIVERSEEQSTDLQVDDGPVAEASIPIPILEDSVAQKTFSILSNEVESFHKDIIDDELASYKNVFLGFVKDCRTLAYNHLENSGAIDSSDEQVKLIEDYQKRTDIFVKEDLPYLEERMTSLRDKLVAFPDSLNPLLSRKILIDGKKRTFKGKVLRYSQNQFLDTSKGIQYRIGLNTALLMGHLRDGLVASDIAFALMKDTPDGHSSALTQSFEQMSIHIQQTCDGLSISLRNSGREMLGTIARQATGVSDASAQKLKTYTNKERKSLLDEIATGPSSWYRNAGLLGARLTTDLKLHRIQLIIAQIGQQLDQEIEASMLSVTNQRLSEAGLWLEDIMRQGTFDPTEIPELDQSLSHDDIRVQGLLSWAEVSGQALPEQLELMLPESIQDLAIEQGDQVESITIDSLASYSHLLTELLSRPVQKHFSTVYQRCMEVLSKAQYDVNQISQKVNLQKGAPDSDQLKALSVEAKDRLERLKKGFNEQEKQLRQTLEDLVLSANGGMNTSTLLDHAVRVIPLTSGRDSQRGLKKWIRTTSEQVSSIIDRIGTKLSGDGEFRSVGSSGLAHGVQSVDMHQALRGYSDSLRLSDEVSDHIPFYYKQLFIGRQAPNVERLRHRAAEIGSAMQILKRNRSGSSSLLVLGAPFSGKSFFAESVAKEAGKGKVIKIQAPVGGSTSFGDLKRTLQKQSGITDTGPSLLHEAAAGTIFLFEDIELWWNRSDAHNLALKHIIELVNDSRSKVRFILTCNHFAYKIMESQGLLLDLTSPRITLSTMDRSGLKDILLERHTAGGLRFELNGKEEEDLSNKEMRKLMDSYYERSNGVIGIALYQWLNSIKNCTEDSIEIRPPSLISLPDMPDKEWLVILSQFIIHKHLDAQRIQRLFQYKDKKKADRVVRQLLTDGLIEDVMGTTYRLNPLVLTAITERAERVGLI